MSHFTNFIIVILSYWCLPSILIGQTNTINTDLEVSVTAAATADFSADLTYTCMGTIQFQDLSTNAPTSWLWQFGDGGLSTQQNPTYTYANSGVYTVTLQITTAQGGDTIVKGGYVTVEKPKITSTTNAEACPNTPATLGATNGTGILRWYDGSNALVYTGSPFMTPPLTATTTYFVEDVLSTTTTQHAGPVNGTTVGSGGYHGGNFTGGVNFTAQQGFQIKSVWVDADGPGPRTIYLYDGHIANGQNVTNTVLGQVTVNIPDGQSRIQLNLQVPGAGDYCLAGNQMDLYRNNNGSAVYPYSLSGVVDMVSPTTSSNGFFYYFYNWELGIQSLCTSARESVVATVVDASFTSVINGGVASFSDASTGATSWLWNFGDGSSSTQQNPTHTYTTTNGPHIVTLTINNGLCSFVDSVTVSVGIEQLANDLTLAIAPNPATNETTLSFSQELPEDLTIELMTMDGRVVQGTVLQTGQTNAKINVRELPSAMYLIRLSTSEMVDVQKIVVQH